jgi:hypothetical protein
VLSGLHCSAPWSLRWRFVRLPDTDRGDTTLALLAECYAALGDVPRSCLLTYGLPEGRRGRRHPGLRQLLPWLLLHVGLGVANRALVKLRLLPRSEDAHHVWSRRAA